MRKDFFENLKAERTTYKEMIDFCCDNLVMNNYIIQELSAKDFYFEIENGTDYDEEEDYAVLENSGETAEMPEEDVLIAEDPDGDAKETPEEAPSEEAAGEQEEE